jgi:membrane protease YdiL (CAAX protease family)
MISPCLLGLLFLFLIPRALIEWRIVTYVLLFILLRDLMTPLGLWEIDVPNGTLRLPGHVSLLLALGILTGGCVVAINRFEPKLAELIVWSKDGILRSLLVGALGMFMTSLLPLVFHLIVRSARRVPPSPSMMLALLFFAFVGNLLEEVLFRGYFQGYLERRTTPLRAALLSGVFFALCHIYLSATVTSAGIIVLLFTLYEGMIAAVVRMRSGVLAASLSHGGAIFLIASSLV